MSTYETVIFDLGGVLIDWNPKHLYHKIFHTEEEINYFLSHICTQEWNEEQDAGRSIQDATALLVQQYPHFQKEIEAYYGRWEEMLGGVITETERILNDLHQKGEVKLLALTNWSAETFPIAEAQFDLLNKFSGILVSGKEGLKKPDPQIYQLLFQRFQTRPETAIFIDDSIKNVKAAQALGIHAIHFKQAGQLRKDLEQINVL